MSWYKRVDRLRMTRFEPETPQHPFSCCASHLLYTDMSVKVIVVFALLVAPLVCGAASSSESPAAGEAKEARNAQHDALQQLLAKRERASDAAHRRETAPRTRSAQTVRRAHLSEDEREIMTKQIMQAISEMMNSECMPDRDYQGWVDFGRRDAD